jgi:drug/metabolite transporter (DMT)-like permease
VLPPLLALLATALLALQHPTTQPILALVDPYFLAIPSYLITAIGSWGIVLVLRERLPVAYLSTSLRACLIPLSAAIVGTASLVSYLVGLSGTHVVVAALILNMTPLWGALWTRVIARKRGNVSPSRFLLSFAICLAGVGLARLGSIKFAFDQLTASWQTLWLFLVPPLYTLRAQLVGLLAARSGAKNAAASTVVTLMAAPLILALAILGWATGMLSLPDASPDLRATAYFVVGTFLSGTVGMLVYIYALRSYRDDQGPVAMFTLLIPGLTAVFGYLLALVDGRTALAPTGWHWIGIVIVGVGLLPVVSAGTKR